MEPLLKLLCGESFFPLRGKIQQSQTARTRITFFGQLCKSVQTVRERTDRTTASAVCTCANQCKLWDSDRPNHSQRCLYLCKSVQTVRERSDRTTASAVCTCANQCKQWESGPTEPQPALSVPVQISANCERAVRPNHSQRCQYLCKSVQTVRQRPTEPQPQPWYICNWMSFTRPVLLGPVIFRTSPPVPWWLSPWEGWDAVTWCGWDKL